MSVGVKEAVVLAGGFGTRLRSVVSDVPKPMAQVAGRPFLELLLAHLARAGHRLFERLLGGLGVQGQSDGHIGDEADPQFRWLEHGAIAADDAIGLQPLQPAQAGRHRQADQFRQLHHGDAAIGLQRAEDFAVDIVELERVHPAHARSVREGGVLVYERV